MGTNGSEPPSVFIAARGFFFGAYMPTLEQHHKTLIEKHGVGTTVTLRAIALALWPDKEWLETRARNGGARIGVRVAGGVAGKMARRGMLTHKINTSDIYAVAQYVINKT